jgi:hypothetical protein
MPGVRAEGDLLRRAISASNVFQPRDASEKDCENDRTMKRVLAVIATTVTASVAGLVVYLLYLLRKSAKDYSDEMYTR